MGGSGSGRFIRFDTKSTVEDCRVLSADQLTRDKTFQLGRRHSGTIRWTNSYTGEEVSSVGFEFNAHDESNPWVRLHYTRTRTGDQEDYKIRLTFTRTPWGAVRWFFQCPLAANDQPCRRRCGKLYCPPGARFYGCRRCYDLTYTSCQESHKHDRIFAAIGAPMGLTAREVAKLLAE